MTKQIKHHHHHIQYSRCPGVGLRGGYRQWLIVRTGWETQGALSKHPHIPKWWRGGGPLSCAVCCVANLYARVGVLAHVTATFTIKQIYLLNLSVNTVLTGVSLCLTSIPKQPVTSRPLSFSFLSSFFFGKG